MLFADKVRSLLQYAVPIGVIAATGLFFTLDTAWPVASMAMALMTINVIVAASCDRKTTGLAMAATTVVLAAVLAEHPAGGAAGHEALIALTAYVICTLAAVRKINGTQSHLLQIVVQKEHDATHDRLTGLANRMMFDITMRREISEAKRSGREVAVVIIDLDGFKKVNDSLGHLAGDCLLMEVANRFTHVIRESDFVARLGGDEFVFVFASPDLTNYVSHIATKIKDRMAEPIVIDGTPVTVSCSMGISMYPTDAVDPVELIKNADIAMYHAKEQGKNNFQFFNDSMNDRVREKLRIENGLRAALKYGHFELYYQPKIDAFRTVVGLEALLRWKTNNLSISPETFIHIAEETGVVDAIGDWVVGEACRQMRQWQDMGLQVPKVSINLSSRQLRQRDLANRILGEMRRYAIDPGMLELELTESAIVTNLEMAQNFFNEVMSAGIAISMDDFGTGHSSLSRLRQIPISTIKIDKSFVDNVDKRVSDYSILDGMVKLAHGLGFGVVAEGVETEDQFVALVNMNCDQMQGYWFSRPIEADDVAAMLERQDRRRPGRTLRVELDLVAAC